MFAPVKKSANPSILGSICYLERTLHRKKGRVYGMCDPWPRYCDSFNVRVICPEGVFCDELSIPLHPRRHLYRKRLISGALCAG